MAGWISKLWPALMTCLASIFKLALLIRKLGFDFGDLVALFFIIAHANVRRPTRKHTELFFFQKNFHVQSSHGGIKVT
jgi:hypothetical protein